MKLTLMGILSIAIAITIINFKDETLTSDSSIKTKEVKIQKTDINVTNEFVATSTDINIEKKDSTDPVETNNESKIFDNKKNEIKNKLTSKKPKLPTPSLNKKITSQPKASKKQITPSIKTKKKQLALTIIDKVSKKESSTSSVASTQSSLSSLYKKLDNSSFGMRYLNETVATSRKINGFYTNHHIYTDYRLDKYHKFTIKPSFKTFHGSANDDSKPEYVRTELRLSRYSFLTAKEHGVNLSVLFRNYLRNGRSNDDGVISNHRVEATLSKGFGKLSVYSSYFYTLNNRDKRTDGIALSNDYIYTAASYSFSDNFYASTTIGYYRSRSVDGNDISQSSSVETSIATGVSIPYGRGFDIEVSYNMAPASKSETNVKSRALKFEDTKDALKNGYWVATLYTSLF